MFLWSRDIPCYTNESCFVVGKWFAEEEKKLAEVVYHLSGANPGVLYCPNICSII